MTMWTVRDGTHVDCDTCGASSPYFDDWEDAVEWAKREGWKFDPTTKENFCKDCQ